MFFSGFKLQPEKLRPEKKVQSSRLTGRFFRRVQITTRKNYDRENKRYSCLADGGGSDLVGTLRPEKNVQSSSRLCFSAGSNYNRKKLRPEKKGTVVWPTFFPVIIFSGRNLIDKETRQKT
jgi:hypothetical protein